MFKRDVKNIKELILKNLREQGLETPLLQKVTFTQKVGSHKAPLQLNVPSAPGTADLSTEALYDLLGRKVCSGQPDSQYKKGVYLKATVSEGRVVVRKIIKK